METVESIEQFILSSGSDDLYTFGGNFQGGVHSQQVPNELARCIFDVMQSKVSVNSYFELGVAAGGTTFIFNHFFHPKNIVLLDTNEHPKSTLRPEVLSCVKYHEIIGDSADMHSDSRVGFLGPYDVMLIDGVHQNPHARNDVFTYSQYLSPGGFLILHDSSFSKGDVGDIVKELRSGKDFEFINEYVVDNRPIVCGIALFRKVI